MTWHEPALVGGLLQEEPEKSIANSPSSSRLRQRYRKSRNSLARRKW
jgi:hypothetical protein